MMARTSMPMQAGAQFAFREEFAMVAPPLP
jgi:hypothetical protein